MAEWRSFNRFSPIIDRYMPTRGEGETMASQIATAVNKLVYKWFNDGDVYDNRYMLEGWANDLSSYANWLYNNVSESQRILIQIGDCETEEDYSDLLYELAQELLDGEFIEKFESQRTTGSIYDAAGPFKFEENYDEED